MNGENVVIWIGAAAAMVIVGWMAGEMLTEPSPEYLASEAEYQRSRRALEAELEKANHSLDQSIEKLNASSAKAKAETDEIERRKAFLMPACRRNGGTPVLGFGWEVVCVKAISLPEVPQHATSSSP
jgi:hypothetical protein